MNENEEKQLTESQKAEITRRQESVRDQAFKMMLKILVIFGVPAFIAVVLGRQLDIYFETGKSITLGLLVIAFVSSWIVVIFMYLKIDKELKAIDSLKTQEKQKALEKTKTEIS